MCEGNENSGKGRRYAEKNKWGSEENEKSVDIRR